MSNTEPESESEASHDAETDPANRSRESSEPFPYRSASGGLRRRTGRRGCRRRRRTPRTRRHALRDNLGRPRCRRRYAPTDFPNRDGRKRCIRRRPPRHEVRPGERVRERSGTARHALRRCGCRPTNARRRLSHLPVPVRVRIAVSRLKVFALSADKVPVTPTDSSAGGFSAAGSTNCRLDSRVGARAAYR